MKKNFLLQLVLETEIKDEEVNGQDGPYERYLKLFIKKLLENPDAVLSFFKEYLLTLFAMDNQNYEVIKKLLEVKEDDKWHFFPVAQQCPDEIRDFIFNIYSSPAPPQPDIIDINTDADADTDTYLSEETKERYRYWVDRRLGKLAVTNAVFKEIPGGESAGDRDNKEDGG
jgi:hypothetical protein